MHNSKTKIAVIGGGFSGLSTACYLAKAGYDVHVYEQHAIMGGRGRHYTENGFVFDMGPSWYWMPDVFERFFNDFNRSVASYYHLIRLDPGYRVFFERDALDVPANIEHLFACFEAIEPGSAAHLKTFLNEAQYKYEVGVGRLVYKPGIKLSELVDPKLLSGIFKLDVFKSLSSHVRKYFKDPRLIQLLEFPVLFLGAKPQQTPALYSLMNYADLMLGTWYPQGGMLNIAKAMSALAVELGVHLHTQQPVKQIQVQNGLTTGIVLESGFVPFDAVISSADYEFTDRVLLGTNNRQYSERYWKTRKMAPSSIIYYLGLNTKIPGVLHHNLFFDTAFDAHAESIYDTPEWPKAPLFYLSCTSKTDPSAAPEGYENCFILIPVAPGLQNAEPDIEFYYNLVCDRIAAKTGLDIRPHVIYRRNYMPSDFVKDYNAFQGNAYGLANTLSQTAHLKPSLRHKKIKNMFFTGQLTVPGPGVPPALISGKLAAEQVMNFFN